MTRSSATTASSSGHVTPCYNATTATPQPHIPPHRLTIYRGWAIFAIILIAVGLAKIATHGDNGSGYIGLGVVTLLVVADRIGKWRNPARPKAAQREPIPRHLKDQIWQRDQGRCQECGSKEWLEVDHVVPVSRGGPTTYRNLQLLCQRCNRRKGAR